MPANARSVCSRENKSQLCQRTPGMDAETERLRATTSNFSANTGSRAVPTKPEAPATTTTGRSFACGVTPP